MHIKKFTQFIVENEHYSSINEAEIVPTVPYNSPVSGTDKLNVTSYAGNSTQINISRGGGEYPSQFSLSFQPSNKPIVKEYEKETVKKYARLLKTIGKETDELAVVTNMADFAANKSSQNYQIRANSIDLLAEFMSATGIVNDATAGANLAKVIATLLLDPKYNTQVTDTFKKFANNIIDNVSNNGFVVYMNDDFISVKQSAGMKAFRTQLVKSYDALTKPKTADAAKK
jgi:hypothetical protein